MMKLLNHSIALLLLILCSGHVSMSQNIGPDTLMVVEPLPTTILPDTINLDSPEFGLKMIPYHGKVISRFGRRGSRMHTGTDVKLAKGDTIRSAFDGVVDIAATHYGYGLLVTINHAHQIKTYYSHLSKILVKKGQPVKAGDVIGLGGATGRATTAHLHFELRVAGKPVNPEQFFDFEGNKYFATQIINNPKAVANAKTQVASAQTASSVKAPASQVVTNVDSDSESVLHTIMRGDTLYSLAKRYGTSIVDLCSLNGITTRTILQIGMVLKVK